MRAALFLLLVGCSGEGPIDQCSGVSDPCITFHLAASPELAEADVQSIAMWVTYNQGTGVRNALLQTGMKPLSRFPISVGLQLPNNLQGPTKVRIEALIGPGPVGYKVLSVMPQPPSQHLDLDVVMPPASRSTCFNNARDTGVETDTDCGGDCPPCGFLKRCVGNADCQSSMCSGGVCQ